MFRLFVFLPLLMVTAGATSTAIPELLWNCYRTNYTETFPDPPLTIKLLIEIIRKIELAEGNYLNLRMLTTSILHAVRLDGIQRSTSPTENESIIPFRASGKQFYKYKLLVDYLTPGEAALFPFGSLTIQELCILHKMISSTVDLWERGDESITCVPTNLPERTGELVGTSRCPVEHGVVKTKYGTISPGHIIAGIASALQETHESVETISDAIRENRTYSFNNLLSNIWVSTIAGDLAEVVINQASTTPEVGNIGYWNNTLYPRRRYLIGNEWDITDAELLGGIDGAVMASKVKAWLLLLSRTRLSQLLDMYYSNRGIADLFETHKACDRFKKFVPLLDKANLTEQVIGTAHLLQDLSNSPELIFEEGIVKLSEIAVEKFTEIAEKKTLPFNSCDFESYDIQNLEIIAIIGGSFDRYKTKELTSAFIEYLDVSMYGSKLAIVNGQTGQWLTNFTSEIMTLFTDLDINNVWPSDLSLTRSFEGVISYYQNKARVGCLDVNSKPVGQIVLVLALSDRIADSDYSGALLGIRSIKESHPEVSVVYVTHEGNEVYAELSKVYENDHIAISGDDVISIVNIVAEKLRRIPAHIFNSDCNETRLEDYVTPNVTTIYEIHETYLRKADFTVKFKGNDYSDAMEICASGTENRTCKILRGMDEVNFTTRDYCSSSACTVRFSVDVNSSKFKCSELDCRYPNQARLDIQTMWTRSGSAAPARNVLMALAMAVIRIIYI